ncbi:MAG: PmoA family protein [Verrucomicrobiales bacterium]|nr:PmoA family protein [Verrucomicrobiales bacterium]
MKTATRLPACIPLLIATLAFLSLSSESSAQKITAQGKGGGWSMSGTNPIQLHWGGEHVTTYQTGDQYAKPFFYPLMGPTGENITRHWPQKEGVEGEAEDHPHHRGMWFGLGSVNGYDFWHEPASGKKPKPFGKIVHLGMGGMSFSGNVGMIKVRSEWQGMDDKKKIMNDEREFRFEKLENGTMIVDAKITLKATAGDVTIHDDKEGAWSIRVMPTLRIEGEVANGSIVNSSGIEGKAAWGKRANWVDYYGPDTAGRTIGVAILDHPSNLRHPTWYHARHYGLFTANPFGQGNFEKETKKGAGDYTIKNGDSLSLNYRTIFHLGDAKAAKIDEAYKAWAAEKK